MAGVPILYLDMTVDSSKFQTDLFKLLSKLRPKWGLSDIESETFSDGFINDMMCFTLRGDREKTDAIVIRIYGINRTTFNKFSRERDFIGMQLGHAAGCFPPVLAVFNNGVAYQYARGHTVTMADLHDPDTIRSVTKKVVALNFLDLSTVSLVDCHGAPVEFDHVVTLHERTKNCMDNLRPHLDDPVKDVEYQKHGMTKEGYIREFSYMDEVVKDLALPRCLGHQDIQVKNLLHDNESGNITLVDYEMFGEAYEGMDLGYLLASPQFSRCLGAIGPDDPDITEDVRARWIRYYVEAYYQLRGWDAKEISPEEVELADIKHRVMETYCSLVFVLTGQLVLSHAPELQDHADTRAMELYKRKYFAGKSKMEELKSRYLRLRVHDNKLLKE